MPEGHAIHHIARQHRRRFVGRALATSSPQGRFRGGARRLNGHTLNKVDAHGKHLFYHWEGELILHVHLGIYGRFHSHVCPPPAPRGAVRLRVVGERYAFDLNGPAACDILSIGERDALVQRLGPDPLRSDGDPERAWQSISNSRAAIGSLLLNQAVIAGVGNIYRAEVLFAAGIHPDRPGHSLSRDEFDAIWHKLRQWMRTGAKHNRIITVQPCPTPSHIKASSRADLVCLYKKDTCPVCGTGIANWKLAARTIFACPTCQT